MLFYCRAAVFDVLKHQIVNLQLKCRQNCKIVDYFIELMMNKIISK